MAYISLPVNFYRLNSEPLDTSSVYSTYHELTSYAANSLAAYSGQVCSVVDDGAYIIKSDKSVIKINTGSGGNSSVSQYKSEYYGSSATYFGSAPTAALETDNLWTIKKSIFSPIGTFISSISAVNIPWTDRYSL
jgi:hypothetical protein